MSNRFGRHRSCLLIILHTSEGTDAPRLAHAQPTQPVPAQIRTGLDRQLREHCPPACNSMVYRTGSRAASAFSRPARHSCPTKSSFPEMLFSFDHTLFLQCPSRPTIVPRQHQLLENHVAQHKLALFYHFIVTVYSSRGGHRLGFELSSAEFHFVEISSHPTLRAKSHIHASCM